MRSGPFNLENEQEILLKYNIDTIVSKNSGGNATYPKIIAARKLGDKGGDGQSSTLTPRRTGLRRR